MNEQEIEKKCEARRAYCRAYDKEWRKNNPKYSADHREQAKRWWKKNPEKGRERSRNNYLKHRIARLEYARKYRQDKKEKIRAHEKIRIQNNPQRRIGIRLRIRIINALAHKGIRKTTKFQELVGATIPEMKLHIEKQFKDGMSWENHGTWHIDHIIPVASFDLTSIDEQKKAFHYTNLQPLWAIDNLRKGAKIPIKL